MKHLPAVEIYSIGTELLNGQIQDTNAYWMAQQITALGGYVRRITILDDEIDEIVSTLKDACARQTRIIITTGGLGPTPDDLTVEAVARIMAVEVVVNESLIEHFMESRKIARREDLSVGLAKMATSPAGSQVHRNPAGVAPCVESQIGATTLFNLPGPPREVEALFKQSLEAPIAQLYSGTRLSLRAVVNLPESACGPILHSVMQLHPNTYLKAFVALSEKIASGQRLPVDIVAWGKTRQKAQELLDATFKDFRQQAAEKGSEVEIIEA